MVAIYEKAFAADLAFACSFFSRSGVFIYASWGIYRYGDFFRFSRKRTAIFSDSAGNGHGIPIFSFVFLIIAGIVFIITLIAAVILTIRGFLKNGGK